MSAEPEATPVHPAPTPRTPLAVILNLIRGALIGMAELVPGISGGTVALVVGIYERALHAGNQLIRREFSKVDWVFLIAVGVGMVTAVFTMSTVLVTFVEGYPELARGLFLGMVAVSILVPVGMMDPRDLRRRLPVMVPLFLLAAVASFLVTGVTAAPQEDPALIIVFLTAAVAVCALVMPGLSGSFLLLAFGLYTPIMASLSDRDWTVIGVFILGALLGVILFVRVLTWILEHHRTVTLTVMSGLMLGSLRALWPWQSAEADLQAPTGSVWPVVGMIVLGVVIVAAFVIADRVSRAKEQAAVLVESAPR